MVEQLPVKELVAGSSPASGATTKMSIRMDAFFVCSGEQENLFSCVLDSKLFSVIREELSSERIGNGYWSSSDR